MRLVIDSPRGHPSDWQQTAVQLSIAAKKKKEKSRTLLWTIPAQSAVLIPLVSCDLLLMCPSLHQSIYILFYILDYCDDEQGVAGLNCSTTTRKQKADGQTVTNPNEKKSIHLLLFII